jgi:molybdate transport system substrate-binding protein
LRVSAAASLTDVLTTADAAWEKAGGVHVQPNFAASNVLARQIIEGAPVDVFISADNAQMDRVAQTGAIDAADRVPLLSNQLVVVVPAGRALSGAAPAALADPSVKRLALGDPQGVPAGVYARSWLERAGVWPRIQSKVVPAASVRAALAAVESGNADAGVVYRTDARGRAGVQVVLEVPLGDAPSIVYPGAALRRSAILDSARHYLQFLQSDQGRRIFTDAGFLSPVSAPAK